MELSVFLFGFRPRVLPSVLPVKHITQANIAADQLLMHASTAVSLDFVDSKNGSSQILLRDLYSVVLLHQLF